MPRPASSSFRSTPSISSSPKPPWANAFCSSPT
jgi:hypothetical protein